MFPDNSEGTQKMLNVSFKTPYKKIGSLKIVAVAAAYTLRWCLTSLGTTALEKNRKVCRKRLLPKQEKQHGQKCASKCLKQKASN